MLQNIIEKIIRFENLNMDEAYKIMKSIIDGNANDCQIASFLTA